MKTLRPLALGVALLAALPALRAADIGPAAASPTTTPSTAAHRPLFLGVELIPVDAPTRALFKLPAVGGLLVTGVAPGSPAEGKIGQGDILLKLDDQTLINREQVRALVRSHQPGQPVNVTLARGGREQTTPLTLAEMPAGAWALRATGADHEGARLAEALRDMRERTKRTLRDVGHPESLLDEAEATLVLPPVPTTVSRVVVLPEGTVTILQRDGKKIVTVKDNEGHTLADGVLDETLRAKLPAWAKSAVEHKPAAAPPPVACHAPRPAPVRS